MSDLSAPSTMAITGAGRGKLPRHIAKKLKKQRVKSLKGIVESEGAEAAEVLREVAYPYPVDGNDHCESPLAAYEDISPILDIIAAKLGKSRTQLRIYDPYYCEGAMKTHLLALGFKDVYNEKEDFYKVIEAKACPEYDVLVTNPPYSNDHVPKLLEFVRGQAPTKPFFLLMPNWVYTKDYYRCMTNRNGMFYLSPSNERYTYTTPKGRRQKKSAKYTSPFPSLWYCGLGCERSPTPKEQGEMQTKLSQVGRVHLAMDVSQLPLSVAHEDDPRKRKARDIEKRRKNKRKKKGGSQDDEDEKQKKPRKVE